MKKIFLGLFFSIAIVSAFCQSPKIIIGIPPFVCHGHFCSMEPVVYDMVSSAFNESGRFTVVDRGQWGAIEKEKDLQKGEDYIDDVKLVNQGHNMGADYIVVGSISNISATKKTTTNNNGQVSTSYAGYVSLTLKVISVSTGQVISSKSINENNGMGGFGLNFATSAENAITKVIKTCSKATKVWIGEAFPVKIKVVKVIDKSDGKAKTLLINGGSENGLTEKTDVRIIYYEDIEMDGKKTQRPVDVAEGRISKIEDQNFSECKLRSNGTEVQKKIDEGQQLYIITTNLK